MIQEDFVSFETAKLLKERGFYGECFSMYVTPKWNSGNGDPNKAKIAPHGRDSNYYDGYMYQCEAPTLQMAMKWLREVHHYYIQVMLDSWACGGHMGYYVVIQKTDSDFEMMLQDALDEVFYKTYEEACEAAIKYCLEHLI